MPECVVCDEVITQPLCAGCLQVQIGTWLQERFPERGELLLSLEDRSAELDAVGGVTTCIKCKVPMNLCSFCYVDHILAWIRSDFPTLVPEFLTFFGFDVTYVERGLVSATGPTRVVST